jgi:hypothetical protein
MPSPHLADGLPSPGFASRSNPAHAPPVAGLSYQQVPYNGPVQYNAAHDAPRPAQSPSANTPPSWPPQRSESQSQTAIPNYPDLRASVGSSYQTTPVRSSPGSERTPGDSPVLDAATQAELNVKIAAEVARFEKKCREIPDTLSAADREEALNKEKRGHATRKSQIRKKYGIQIRTSKLQPANFVRIPGQGDAPILAPISRIAAFRAPPANMTPTYAISTPSSVEQGRQRPIMENPDPKRRKLENSPPLEQDSNLQNRSEPDGVSGEMQRRPSAQSPEILEVDGLVAPDKPEPASPQPSSTKPPKKVQWETLPREPSPPSAEPTALRDISNKAVHKPKPKSGKSDTDLAALSAAEGSDGSGSEDSDVDPDEDIPARLPPGVAPRRITRRSAGSASASASLSASPAPPSTAKKTGSGLFSSTAASAAAAAAAASSRSPEEERAAERRGSLRGERARAVVQV